MHFRSSSGVNLVFALVVMSSYFSIFGVLQTASLVKIFLLVAAGTVYILVGIYGFEFCREQNNRMYNAAYFAFQIAVGGLLVYLGLGIGSYGVILLPLAAHAVMLLDPYESNFATVGIMLAYFTATYFSRGSLLGIFDALATFVVELVIIVLFTQMMVQEERARGKAELLAQELEDANQQLREYALQVEELAISKERNRLAREIHDGLGHSLTTIFMQIQAARAVLSQDPKRTETALETAQALTQKALTDVRSSVSALRASPEEGLPLVEQIREVVKSCEMAGIPVDFTILGTPRTLAPQSQLTLFRSVQEGINNVCKHAAASHAWVTLDYEPDHQVRLKIRDDGVGSDHLEGGFGLMGMRERVRLVNGQLNIDSAPGKGMSLEIVVPDEQ